MSQWAQQWDVKGSGKTYYTISRAHDGSYACSCPSWTKHSPREDCKHILRHKLMMLTDDIWEKKEEAKAPKTATLEVKAGRKFR